MDQSDKFAEMTSKIKLGKELVSLVHFVELNESGWVKKTLARIILSILRGSSGSLTQEEVAERLAIEAAHGFHNDEIATALTYLISDGKVVERTKGSFQVRLSAMHEIDAAIALTSHEEEVTKTRFISSLSENAPGLDGTTLWPTFLERYLYPLIQDAGASALDLVSGHGNPIASKESLHPFLEYIDRDRREEAAHAVIQFLDPSVTEVRQFILKRLATSFFVAAISLDKSTIDALEKKRKKDISLKLFLDTNALFSALSLHEHDGNADVEGLLALNRSASAKVKLKLFVLPETVSEATHVLANAASSLGSNRYPAPLAAAGLRANVSGVRAKFLQAAARASTVLSAKEYFDPYVSDLPAVLRSRGIEIIDRSLLVSRLDQEVIDDVAAVEEWERVNVSEERRKGYAAVFHDVYAWHCISRSRSPSLNSPIDVQEWFITLDRRLLGFDAFKRKGNGSPIPTCIRPSTFLAYSQFWTPRTAELEQALLGSLRLPLLFREFDAETEDVTLAILRKLSRFESVGDFSTDELQGILLNRAVRTKFVSSRDDQQQQELIRDQLLQAHSQTATRANELAGLLASTQEKAGQLNGELSETTQKAVAALSALELERASTAKKKEEDEERIKDLTALAALQRAQLDHIESERARRRGLLRFSTLAFLCPLAVGGASSVILYKWFTLPYAVAAGGLLAVCLSFWLGVKLSRGNESVEETRWLQLIINVMKFFWVPAVAFVCLTASAVYQNVLQDKQPMLVDRIVRTVETAKIQKPLSNENKVELTNKVPTNSHGSTGR